MPAGRALHEVAVPPGGRIRSPAWHRHHLAFWQNSQHGGATQAENARSSGGYVQRRSNRSGQLVAGRPPDRPSAPPGTSMNPFEPFRKVRRGPPESRILRAAPRRLTPQSRRAKSCHWTQAMLSCRPRTASASAKCLPNYDLPSPRPNRRRPSFDIMLFTKTSMALISFRIYNLLRDNVLRRFSPCAQPLVCVTLRHVTATTVAHRKHPPRSRPMKTEMQLKARTAILRFIASEFPALDPDWWEHRVLPYIERWHHERAWRDRKSVV